MSKELLQILFDKDFQMQENQEFYNKIINDIKYFRISSQVFMLLNQRNELVNTPKYFQDFLEQRYMRTLYINMFIKNELETIFSNFEEEQINVIPLKGVVFAEKAFGQLGARATSDIDILIKQKDLSRTVQLVKKLGFELEEEPIPSHFHCSFSKNVPSLGFPLTIEIHWGILKESTSDLNIHDFWEEALPYNNYKYIKQLSDYHTFYMICLHGWRHNLDSLKYFIDIIQLIYLFKDTLDYQRLFRDANSHKTLKRLRRTLMIVYQQYPKLSDIKPFPNKYRLIFWDFRAFRDPDYKSIKKYIDFIDYQLFSYDRFSHSFKELIFLLKNSQRSNH